MTGEVEESAFAMIGGIAVATLLTLLFLPALYVAWYRLKEPIAEPTPEPSR
jgi:multidrug efflux pump